MNISMNPSLTNENADRSDVAGRLSRRFPCRKFSAATMLGVVLSSALPSSMFADAIRSGVGWHDDNGDPVSARGACIVKENGLFYLFGEFKNDSNNAFSGISCYSSSNLVHWKFENLVLSVQPSGRLGPNTVGERPKVLKCPTTGRYVMYVHSDALDYRAPAIEYAICDTIAGTYTYMGPLLQTGHPIRKWDIGAFQDDDGTGYVITHSGCLYKLGAGYTNIVEATVTDAFRDCEAPAIFKNNGVYFWLGSGLTGWERNDNYYYTATNIAGPWTSQGHFAPAGTLTWNSQTTFVLPIKGSKSTTFMFMGDRWAHPRQRSAATYLWQPLLVAGDRISLTDFKESWRVDVQEGTWCTVTSAPREVIEHTNTNRIHYSPGWNIACSTGGLPAACSAVSNATLSVEFHGSRVGLYGVGRPDGGFARVEVHDSHGRIVISRLIETYCKYPETSLKFLSPVLEAAKYRLTVTVLGEHFSWKLKNGTLTGSAGDFVSATRVVVE